MPAADAAEDPGDDEHLVVRRVRRQQAGRDRQRDAEDQHQLAAVAVADRARGRAPTRPAPASSRPRSGSASSATSRTPCRSRAARRWPPPGSGWRPRRPGSARASTRPARAGVPAAVSSGSGSAGISTCHGQPSFFSAGLGRWRGSCAEGPVGDRDWTTEVDAGRARAWCRRWRCAPALPRPQSRGSPTISRCATRRRQVRPETQQHRAEQEGATDAASRAPRCALAGPDSQRLHVAMLARFAAPRHRSARRKHSFRAGGASRTRGRVECRLGHALLGQQRLLVEHVQQHEGGHDQDRGEAGGDQDRGDGAGGRRAGRDRQRRRAAGSPTAPRPRPGRRWPPRRRRPAALRAGSAGLTSTRAARPHTAERITSGRAREVSPSKRYSASLDSTKIPPNDTSTGGHRGGGGPTPEVGHHRLVREPAGVPDQEEGGEVRGQAYGEHATEDGGRVDPAVPRIARLAPGRDPPRGDAADHGAQAVGHEHGRDGEGRAEVAPVPGAEHRLAEREARRPGARCPGRPASAGRRGSG